MPTSVRIDPQAVLALSDTVTLAADDAATLRTGVLRWFGAADLDGAPTAGQLADADDGLTLLATVLRARATQAAYPMADLVGVSLAADVAEADRALLTYLGPDPARVADGQRAAAELRDGGEMPSDELVARIRASADDPSFVLGFVNALGLDGAAGAIVRASSTHPDAYGGLSAPPEREAWGARQRALLDALGTTLATASMGTGAFANQAGDADAWVAAITADPSSTRYGGEGAALALLAMYGRLQPDVLADVAEGVYRYERAWTEQSDAALWQPRSDNGSTYLGVRTPEGLHAYDPLASLLTALGDQPLAAQTFFCRAGEVVRDVDGSPRRLNERLVYLFEARRWPTDSGAGFGRALAAATTELRDYETEGMRSATLASQTIAIVAGHTGYDDGFLGDGWYAPVGTRHALAEIVADYMPDVFATLQRSGPLDPAAGWYADSPAGFPPNGPYGIVTTQEMLATVIRTIGTNPDDAQLLLASVLTTQQLHLRWATHELALANPTLAADLLTDAGGGGARRSLAPLSNAASNGAAALGFIVHQAYVGDSQDQARMAAAQQRWAELLQLGISLPFVPTPAGPWGKLLVGQATSRLFNAWKAGVPSDAASEYGTIDETIETRMEQVALNTLAAEGLLHPTEPIIGYEPPPDSAFMVNPTTGRPIRPLQFDFSSPGYAAWAMVYKPTQWFNANFALPYIDAFPRIGG